MNNIGPMNRTVYEPTIIYELHLNRGVHVVARKSQFFQVLNS